MFSRIFISAALLISLVGSREMQVFSGGGSSTRACSECRFLAAVASDDSSISKIATTKEGCCPTGACCPDGPCCVSSASKVIADTTKASCCPTGACCPDGPCCTK